ncbi:hypothetical protein RhiirA4_467332 [Rhizophagus irregularis]|uniref:Uncharacterized protein n=1 Tax=Rhizophagus irregularis TaxID=588596 RepID=A0A2I1GVQ7_9GLOM|nr:hypothetical protein RhiirA4_467332 [Rhizophagus irregularis]
MSEKEGLEKDITPNMTKKMAKKNLNELNDNTSDSLSQPDKRVKLDYRRVTDQPISHKVPITESLVDDSNHCTIPTDETETTDCDDNTNTIRQPSSTTEDQNSALKTLLTSNDLAPLFATFFKAMVSSISAESAEKLMNTDHDHSDTTPSNNNRLATLFINESKVLFLRIRKPPPELILTLARECARHLEITELDANKAKQKGCGWFATWRVRLYNECTELAFSFLDNYNVSMDDLPNSSHLRNFVSADDITNIFEPQLKQVRRDSLLENQLSWNALKSYLAEVTLTMIHYFVCKNIDRNRYNNSTKGQRVGWRNAMLSDLHSLDRITIDIRVVSESGVTLAQNLNIRSYVSL